MAQENIQKSIIYLAAILAIGFLARAWGITDRSLWFDEGASVYFASLDNWAGWTSDVHPPLYYIALHYWMMLDSSDGALRLFSVVLGVANIGLVYLLGQHLANRRVGLWAAAFLSVYVAHVWYGQEVRMYALLMFLYTLGAVGFVTVAKTRYKKIGAGLFAFGAASMFYVQGLGPLYAATLSCAWLAWIIARRTWPEFRIWITANVLVLALFAPWAGIYLSKVHETASSSYGLSAWIAKPAFSQILSAPVSQTISAIPAIGAIITPNWIAGKTLLGAWWWYLPLLTAALMAAYHAKNRRGDTFIMLGVLYALPLIGVYVASLLLQPIFIVRNVLVISIPLVLFISLAEEIEYVPAWLRRSILGACLITFAIGTVYLQRYGPNFAIHDEGWDKTARYLKGHVTHHDVLLVDMENDQGVRLLYRYDPAGVIARMETRLLYAPSSGCQTSQACMEKNVRGIPAAKTVWILSAHVQAVPNHDSLYAWLMSKTKEYESKKFNSISLTRAIWSPEL